MSMTWALTNTEGVMPLWLAMSLWAGGNGWIRWIGMLGGAVVEFLNTPADAQDGATTAAVHAIK